MMGYLMDGGWMMLPLLICSIVMVAVIIIAIPGVVACNYFQKKAEGWDMQLESAVADFNQAIGA